MIEQNDYEAENWSVLANDPTIGRVHGFVIVPILVAGFSMAIPSLFTIVGPICLFIVLMMIYIQVKKKSTFAGFSRYVRQKVSGKRKPTITTFERITRQLE